MKAEISWVRKEDEKKIINGNNKTFKIKNVGKSFFMSCWLKGPTNLIFFEMPKWNIIADGDTLHLLQ